jgi:hypothetical protein
MRDGAEIEAVPCIEGQVSRMNQPTATTTTTSRLIWRTLLALVVLGGVLLALSSGPADAATTFTVNNTGDRNDLDFPNGTFDGSSDGKCDSSGRRGNQCTLRAAIQEANNTSGGVDTIEFAIGGRATVKTIKVGSTGNGALPLITDTVTIDGYAQRRAKENTRAVGNDAVLKIQLDGTDAGTSANGLTIETAESTIRGLVINRFAGHGILIRKLSGSGATGNHVEGNFIGTNATGTRALGNGGAGVLITSRDAENDAENNTIGGTQPAQRNVISGNRGTESPSGGIIFGAVGIRSSPAGNQGNQVLGNYIGTNAKGTAALGNGGGGVRIFDAPNNTIGGTGDGARNIISGNRGAGVSVSRGFPETGNGTGNKVEGNYIGTNASGTQDLGNTFGVSITGWYGNAVGGTAAGAGNTISGNDNSGVQFSLGAQFNKVEGNRIGTNAAGTEALPNDRGGVLITGSGHTIGGTEEGARNIISGNGGDGVRFFGTDHHVLGNFIGTDVSGTGDLGNSGNGVEISAADDNAIGGTTAAARNVISGNGENGVFIFPNADQSATGNRVEGNRIGTRADGTGDLGNDDDGVEIVNADNNAIGGMSGGAGNAISANGGNGVEIRSINLGENPGATGNQVLGNGISTNGGDGVEISSSGATGNRVLSNFMLGNTGLGIDLGADGVTANDPGDADTGANNLQNFPEELQAIRSNTTGLTTITGKVKSNPSQSYTIQCFVAAPDNTSGNGEGHILVDTETETDTDRDGQVGFSCLSPVPQTGQAVTATATNMSGTATNTATGDTSEFALNVTVVPGP